MAPRAILPGGSVARPRGVEGGTSLGERTRTGSSERAGRGRRVGAGALPGRETVSDRLSRMVAEYAAGVRGEDVPPEALHEAKRRLLDSIGVALAAFTEDSPRAARAYAYDWPASSGATLWGTPWTASVEAAAFANGVAVRYLDFNDTYLSKEPLHPSDCIPALFALAEWRGIPPREFLTAVVTAYEIGVTLCDAAALRQTRAGELSMWKGAAAANAARNALFAALVASKGMTGPAEPFEGEMGFVRQLLGGEGFEEEALRPLAEKRPPRRICETYVKYWPVEYHAQSAVDAAVQLRAEVGDPGRIAAVHIDTFRAAYEIIAKDREKWEPKTRETADHSLPYIVAVALWDGTVTRLSFSPERIADPAVRALLRDRTTLREDPDLTAGYPEGIPNRVRVTTDDGRVLEREVRFPRGHARNPMSDAEVIEKFRRNAAPVVGLAQAERVITSVMEVEAQADLRGLAQLVRV